MADKRRDYTPLSDEELDALAEITPDDIERAKASFEKHAPPRFRKLLDAKPGDTRRDAE